jgi:hypothetical protein
LARDHGSGARNVPRDGEVPLEVDPARRGGSR